MRIFCLFAEAVDVLVVAFPELWRGSRCVADAGTDNTPLARTGFAIVTWGCWELMLLVQARNQRR